ncbi:MAG: sigma-70 family RNA polymerase sigma factor [Candidatus Eisenbacteria bacterium]|nr:sigma-70 family RNA polymerase sigma factor [Candidatus Eisenbacteria bacterium]
MTAVPASESGSVDSPREFDELFGLVYDEVRGIAGHLMRAERTGHTLQPTALVHEAYLKLKYRTRMVPRSREHVIALVAQAMRRILVSYARAHRAEKRGGDQRRVTLDGRSLAGEDEAEPIAVLALEAALEKLAADTETGPRKVRVIELVYFGGLSLEEAASVLDVSERTIRRDWRYARVFLKVELSAS